MNPVSRMFTIRSLWTGAVLTIGAAGLIAVTGSAALAQGARPQRALKLPTALVIYRGDSLQTSGFSLANWGSGTVDEDTSKIFSGTESLKITTHGMYQGASLNFVKPVNLGPYLAGKYNYLTVMVQLPAPNPSGGAGGFPGYGKGNLGGPFGSGGGNPEFPGLSGGSGGNSGGGSAGTSPYGGKGGGYGGGGQLQMQKNRKLENLRLVLLTSTGRTIDAMLPVENAAEENQWKTLAIPLSAIPNLSSDDAQIQSIRVFGDAPATLNVGSIGIVEDSSRIILEPINDKTVQRLAKYQYLATASAGVTPLLFSWDWDAADGIQDETHGHNVTHTFRKASVDDNGKNTDFVVTVTVSDLYGIKTPVKTSFKVHVTP